MTDDWTPPTPKSLFAAFEQTWPPRKTIACGPITVREGAGGGRRVSAATVAPAGASQSELAAANDLMESLGQVPQYQIRPENLTLDSQLAQMGFHKRDPTVILESPVGDLRAIPSEGFPPIRVGGPMGILEDIWAEGGIGPERLAVMDRVTVPKVYLLARKDDQPLGAAFAAVAGDICFVHALHISEAARRQGLGSQIMRAAADWAAEQGAQTIALAILGANEGGAAFYQKLGMRPFCHYYYCVKETE